MKMRDEAVEEARATQNTESWSKYKNLRNICNNLTKKDKKEFYSDEDHCNGRIAKVCAIS